VTPKEPLPARLHVAALPDPHHHNRGHRPGSAYVEAVYLGHLGPTATWLWQRLARTATARPATIVDTTDLAVSLGLGHGLGANAPLARTIGRLERFDTVHRTGDVLAVRTALPDLPARQLARLSASARLAHQHLATTTGSSPQPVGPPIEKAVGL
jgi:hypothetical protein